MPRGEFEHQCTYHGKENKLDHSNDISGSCLVFLGTWREVCWVQRQNYGPISCEGQWEGMAYGLS